MYNVSQATLLAIQYHGRGFKASCVPCVSCVEIRILTSVSSATSDHTMVIEWGWGSHSISPQVLTPCVFPHCILYLLSLML